MKRRMYGMTIEQVKEHLDIADSVDERIAKLWKLADRSGLVTLNTEQALLETLQRQYVLKGEGAYNERVKQLSPFQPFGGIAPRYDAYLAFADGLAERGHYRLAVEASSEAAELHLGEVRETSYGVRAELVHQRYQEYGQFKEAVDERMAKYARTDLKDAPRIDLPSFESLEWQVLRFPRPRREFPDGRKKK